MKKAFLQLHMAIFLAGFTGILGRLITINEGMLVWYRMLFTIIALWIIVLVTRKNQTVIKKELVKMYLIPEARGRGIGKHIILKCLEAARQQGFHRVYLETMPELKQALKVYELFGFEYLDRPMGNSGHFGCDRWMLKKM